MEDSLFSVKQAAIILKVHHLTIRRYIKDGQLKAVRIGGNVRIPQSSIDQFSHAIYPTQYGQKKDAIAAKLEAFSLDDPLFRLKSRGLSLKPSDF